MTADTYVPKYAKTLWALGARDLERDGSSGISGITMQSGARCIVAIENMSLAGIDVKAFLDAAQAALTAYDQARNPSEGE